ncbi:TetR/AcrR family transcriptional regulator [Chloroflexota bacterium]
MNGFERRKAKKKEGILKAAQELFQAHGFKKVSINDIARTADVSPVTIYNHFNSKDILIREVIKNLLDNMMSKYRNIIYGKGSFLKKMETIIFDKTDIVSRYQTELAQAIYHNDPALKQLVNDLWPQEILQMTIDLFEDGKRQGYVSPNISQEALVLYLELFRSGAAANPKLFSNIAPRMDIFRELNSLFVYGLLGKRDNLPETAPS